MKRLRMLISDADHAELLHYASQDGTTMARQMRKCVRSYLRERRAADVADRPMDGCSIQAGPAPADTETGSVDAPRHPVTSSRPAPRQSRTLPIPR